MKYIEKVSKLGIDEYNERKFITKWIDDEDIRTYKKMDLYPPPLVCPEGVYNLWNGFSIERSKAVSSGNIAPFIEYINYIVNKDEKCFDYFVKWIAAIFQSPGKICGTAGILRGEQGSGKSILCDLLMEKDLFITAETLYFFL
jgi:hypothetical protein